MTSAVPREYFIERSTGERIATVGSSNFSSTGFGDWWEGNLLVEEPERSTKSINISSGYNRVMLSRFSGRLPIKVSLPRKIKETDTNRHYKVFGDHTNSSEDPFTIPIRLNGNAGLNPFMSKGRKEKKSTPTTPRFRELRDGG